MNNCLSRMVWLGLCHLVLWTSLAAEVEALGLPRPDHVVLVIEENHSFSSIIGSPDAPFTNALAARGALLTRSFAVTHPSQPNYLALFSGSLQGVDGNACPNQFRTPNLASALLHMGLTFAGYAEDLPEAGSTTCKAGAYVRKHNPWVNWQHTESHGIPPETNLPWSAFPSDYSRLPTVSIVIPNLLNDMHDGSDPERIRRGDRWLRDQLGAFVEWAQTHNSLFILTWDEDGGQDANHIATILVGPMVRPGRSDQRVSHFNLLRTIEDVYALPHSGHTAKFEPLRDLWVSPSSTPERPAVEPAR